MKKELVVMVGNIGAGKSTYVKELQKKGYVVICRDSLRYAIGAGNYIFNLDYEPAIYAIETYMLRNFLKLGIPIVMDEVGVSKKMRKKYIDLGKQFGYKLTAIVMPRYSQEICVNRRMQDPHGQFDRNIWNNVWESFNSTYQTPTKEEGFDKIIKKKPIILAKEKEQCSECKRVVRGSDFFTKNGCQWCDAEYYQTKK